MRVTDLDTPALLIDLDIMERNLRRVADYVKAHGLRLRPHTKTHKIPALGRRQLDLGAVGLTVAKVGEAEVMLGAAPAELLVGYPVIGRAKLERLIEVARKTRVLLALDNLSVAQALSDAAHAAGTRVGVLAEIDAGMNRVGVTPGPELLQLVQDIDRLPGLTWEGLTFFPGQIHGTEPEDMAELRKVADMLANTLADLRREGFSPRVVSGGSTPTLFHSHTVAGLTEIRPGTYIFNDRNTWAAGGCGLDDCAASMLCTVVSTARPGQVIVDGGSKTFSSDCLMGGSASKGFGYLPETPEVHFAKMSEEHGFLDTQRAGVEYAIGDRVRIIPNHVCTALNLHERVYGVRGDRVDETWRVEGRGKLQ